MALDFDPTVVGIASQPFWLSWASAEGRVRSHVPDYFARRADGSAVVVDCRPVERRPVRDLAAFDAMRRACEVLGWEYRLVGAPDPIVAANLRWLAGYRHPRHYQPGCGLMDGLARAVLRAGDWVSFDGGEHQVVAESGTSVRLRSVAGADQVVLASYLLAAADFAVVDGTPVAQVEPFGLRDGLPEDVLAEARDWERHVVEVETGLPPGAGPGSTARAEYDPAVRTLVQRTEAKAAELGVGFRTVERMRARYAQQGLWGVVDRRLVRSREATGRVDARLVAVARQVIEAETHASTGTRGRLIRRVVKAVEDVYGPGVVPLPGRSTFYKLVDALSTGRHTFGSAVTRRQTASRPAGPFTPTFAARPGEQVQIDSTPIDVMVLLESGMPARADLTIAVDVATRTICAAVLRPVGTKAVDAALLLARMLVPEPMRPGWAGALRMSASRLPHARLVDVDARMELAAAKPVIVPDTIVIDGGKVFVSDTFIRACAQCRVA